VKTLQLLGYTS